MDMRQLLAQFKLPSKCLICHGWNPQTICQLCLDHYLLPQLTKPRCSICATSLNPLLQQPICGHCRQQKNFFEATFACVDFGFPWSQIINDFKFKANFALAKVLADYMLYSPLLVTAVQQADAIIPIPLAKPRLQQRGFNQAALMARVISKQLDKKLMPYTLIRTKHSQPLHQLSKTQRLRSISGAFKIIKSAKASLAQTHIILVDDVMTSGATLNSAAKTLKTAGVSQITVAVFARTPLN